MTRMAVAALLRELLFKTRRYRDDKLAGKNPPFDMKLEAMLPVINGEIPLKCHAHRADDILTAVRIARSSASRPRWTTVPTASLSPTKLAKEGLPVFVGPTLGSKSKAELRHKSFTTPGVLYHAGLTVSIITDAPVIPLGSCPCAPVSPQTQVPLGRGVAGHHHQPPPAAWASTAVWAVWNPAGRRSGAVDGGSP